jgi:hypothetical protein
VRLETIGEGTEFHGKYSFGICPALRSNPRDFGKNPLYPWG